MKPKVTLAMFAILVALGAYTFMYESKPKDVKPSTSPDEVQVLKFDSADLKGFTVNSSDGTLTVERVKGKWEDTKTHTVLDTDKVDSPLRNLQDLKSRRKLADKPSAADMTTYGLDKPEVTVSFDWRDAKDKAKSLNVGKDNLEKSGYYARTTPGETVYVVDKFAVDNLAGLIKHPPVATPTPKAPTGAGSDAAVTMPGMPIPSMPPAGQ